MAFHCCLWSRSIILFLTPAPVCVPDRSTEVSTYAVTEIAEASTPAESVELLSLHFNTRYLNFTFEDLTVLEKLSYTELVLALGKLFIFIAACSVFLRHYQVIARDTRTTCVPLRRSRQVYAIDPAWQQRNSPRTTWSAYQQPVCQTTASAKCILSRSFSGRAIHELLL